MPPFDVSGAKAAGYSDDEIIGHLVKTRKFDAEGAKKAGYSSQEILNHLLTIPTEPEIGTGQGRVSKSLERGYEGLKSTGYGLAALGADVVGAEDFGTSMIEKYKQTEANAQALASDVPTYKDIHSFGDAGKYAVDNLFENLPMLIPSLVSGGVGAAVARKGAEKLVAGMVAKKMGEGLSKEAAEKAAASMVAKRVAVGSAAGAYVPSAGMEIGSIYNDIVDETGERGGKGVAAAVAGGLVAGALDVVAEVPILGKMFGESSKIIAGGLIKRLGVTGAKQFLLEGGTEGLQTVVEQLSAQAGGSNKALDWDEVIDATLKGGIFGVGIGSGTELLFGHGAKQTTDNNPPGPLGSNIGEDIADPTKIGFKPVGTTIGIKDDQGSVRVATIDSVKDVGGVPFAQFTYHDDTNPALPAESGNARVEDLLPSMVDTNIAPLKPQTDVNAEAPPVDLEQMDVERTSERQVERQKPKPVDTATTLPITGLDNVAPLRENADKNEMDALRIIGRSGKDITPQNQKLVDNLKALAAQQREQARLLEEKYGHQPVDTTGVPAAVRPVAPVTAPTDLLQTEANKGQGAPDVTVPGRTYEKHGKLPPLGPIPLSTSPITLHKYIREQGGISPDSPNIDDIGGAALLKRLGLLAPKGSGITVYEATSRAEQEGYLGPVKEIGENEAYTKQDINALAAVLPNARQTISNMYSQEGAINARAAEMDRRKTMKDIFGVEGSKNRADTIQYREALHTDFGIPITETKKLNDSQVKERHEQLWREREVARQLDESQRARKLEEERRAAENARSEKPNTETDDTLTDEQIAASPNGTDVLDIGSGAAKESATRIGKVEDVNPNDLVFLENEQNNTEDIKKMFPKGEGYYPIVLKEDEDGSLSILDGHNRAAVAIERGDNIPSVRITQKEYDFLKSKGFDDQEISYAALTDARQDDAASGIAQKFRGADVHGPGGEAANLLDDLRLMEKLPKQKRFAEPIRAPEEPGQMTLEEQHAEANRLFNDLQSQIPQDRSAARRDGGEDAAHQYSTPANNDRKRVGNVRELIAKRVLPYVGTTFDRAQRAVLNKIDAWVSRVVPDVPVYVVSKAIAKQHLGNVGGGWYDPVEHAIYLVRGNYDSKTLLHEAVHAALVRELHNNPALFNYTERLRQFVESSDTNKDFYGLKDVHEFLAEAMSNRKFQKYLAEMPAPKWAITNLMTPGVSGEHRSMWDALVGAVAKFVRNLQSGGGDIHSVLDAVMRVPEAIDAIVEGRNEYGEMIDGRQILAERPSGVEDPFRDLGAGEYERAVASGALADAKAPLADRRTGTLRNKDGSEKTTAQVSNTVNRVNRITGGKPKLASETISRPALWFAMMQGVGRKFPVIAEFQHWLQSEAERETVLVKEGEKTIERMTQLDYKPRKMIEAVMEFARLTNTNVVPRNGRITVVMPENYQGSLGRPGEVFMLDKNQSEIFMGMKDYFKKRWEDHGKAIAKNLEYEGAWNAGAIQSALSEAQAQGNNQRAKKLEFVNAIFEDAKRRENYVPFSRSGDEGFKVKDTTTGKVEYFEMVNTKNVWGGLTGSNVKKNEVITNKFKELRKKFPDDKRYDITNDPIVSKDIEELDVSLIEKLLAATNIADKKDRNSAMNNILNALKGVGLGAKDVKNAMRETFIDQVNKAQRAGFTKESHNTPGYSTDFLQSIIDYNRASASVVSGVEHSRVKKDAYNRTQDALNVPENIRNYANRINNYLDSDEKLIGQLKQYGFWSSLWGSASSALVNLTQTPTVTAAQIAGWAGVPAAGRVMRLSLGVARALSFDKRKGIYLNPNKIKFNSPQERVAFMDAHNRGRINPTVTQDLHGSSPDNWQEVTKKIGNDASSKIQKVLWNIFDVGTSAFNGAEQVNRATAWLAAYREAQAPGAIAKFKKMYANDARVALIEKQSGLTPAAIADFFVNETQFIGGKIDRPEVLRGVGGIAFQFKQYPMNYLRILKSNMTSAGPEGKVAGTMMLMALVAFGGAFGLPFADDLVDAYEFAMKHLTGIDPMIEYEIRHTLEGIGMSPAWAEAMTRGPARFMGIDVSKRIGQGQILPDANPIMNIPILSATVGKAMAAYKRFDSGQPMGGAIDLASIVIPKGPSDMLRGLFQLPSEGYRTQGGDMKVAEPNIGQRVAKTAGFQPTKFASEQERDYFARRLKYRTKEAEDNLSTELSSNLMNIMLAREKGDEQKAEKLTKNFADRYQRAAANFANPSVPLDEKVQLPSATSIKNRAVLMMHPELIVKNARKLKRPALYDLYNPKEED